MSELTDSEFLRKFSTRIVGTETWNRLHHIADEYELLSANCEGEQSILRTENAKLKVQAQCNHLQNVHNGISHYAPYKHGWKCNKCGHTKEDEMSDRDYAAIARMTGHEIVSMYLECQRLKKEIEEIEEANYD